MRRISLFLCYFSRENVHFTIRQTYFTEDTKYKHVIVCEMRDNSYWRHLIDSSTEREEKKRKVYNGKMNVYRDEVHSTYTKAQGVQRIAVMSIDWVKLVFFFLQDNSQIKSLDNVGSWYQQRVMQLYACTMVASKITELVFITIVVHHEERKKQDKMQRRGRRRRISRWNIVQASERLRSIHHHREEERKRKKNRQLTSERCERSSKSSERARERKYFSKVSSISMRQQTLGEQ